MSKTCRYHFRYQTVTPSRLRITIHQIPSDRDLKKINELCNILTQSIPFFFEVWEKASVVAVSCESGKQRAIQVQMVIEHELEIAEALFQLGQCGFLEINEQIIA